MFVWWVWKPTSVLPPDHRSGEREGRSPTHFRFSMTAIMELMLSRVSWACFFHCIVSSFPLPFGGADPVERMPFQIAWKSMACRERSKH